MCKNINERLKLIRDQKGWSIEKLSQDLSVHRNTIHNYEKNRMPPADFLERFVIHTCTNPIWLLTGKGSQFMTSQEESEEDVTTVRVNLKKGQRLIVNYED